MHKLNRNKKRLVSLILWYNKGTNRAGKSEMGATKQRMERIAKICRPKFHPLGRHP